MKKSFWSFSLAAVVLAWGAMAQAGPDVIRQLPFDSPVFRSGSSGTPTFPLLEDTGFEAADGWVPGWVCGPDFEAACVDDPTGTGDPDQTCGAGNTNPQGWWLSGTGTSCREPHIDTVNPFAGTQHLRFAQDPIRAADTDNGCPSFAGICRNSIFTINMGAQITLEIGRSVLTAQVAGSNTFGSDLQFLPQTVGDSITGLMIFNYYGTIFIYDAGMANYVDTGVYWTTGSVYEEVQIEADPCAQELNYYYGGAKIWTDSSGVLPFSQVMGQLVALTDNFPETYDIDDFSIVREDPCPTECGNDVIEPGEECETNDDSNCPGRCVAPGEDGECTCIVPAASCETAEWLRNGNTASITHGGWYTWVADTPSYALETCGSTGFDSYLFMLAGTCDELQILVENDDCDSDPGNPFGAGTDPLGSCNPVSSPWESCACVSTNIGERYYAWVARGDSPGAVSDVTLSKRLDCGELFENGACCDRATGTCTDDVAEGDCQGVCQSYTASKLCGSDAAGPCEPATGACCDSSPGSGGACTDGALFADCQGEQQSWTCDATCAEVTCEEALGACCDSGPGSGGSCSQTLQADCSGDQQSWTKGADCGEISCEETSGACCDGLTGSCSGGVLSAACTGSHAVWSKGQSCGEVDCSPALGACCNREDGSCSQTTRAGCATADDPEFGWQKGVACGDQFDCEPDFQAIPTVSEWGLVIMTLLLLTGAKIYFGRRRVATA